MPLDNLISTVRESLDCRLLGPPSMCSIVSDLDGVMVTALTLSFLPKEASEFRLRVFDEYSSF